MTEILSGNSDPYQDPSSCPVDGQGRRIGSFDTRAGNWVDLPKVVYFTGSAYGQQPPVQAQTAEQVASTPDGGLTFRHTQSTTHEYHLGGLSNIDPSTAANLGTVLGAATRAFVTGSPTPGIAPTDTSRLTASDVPDPYDNPNYSSPGISPDLMLLTPVVPTDNTDAPLTSRRAHPGVLEKHHSGGGYRGLKMFAGGFLALCLAVPGGFAATTYALNRNYPHVNYNLLKADVPEALGNLAMLVTPVPAAIGGMLGK